MNKFLLPLIFSILLASASTQAATQSMDINLKTLSNLKVENLKEIKIQGEKIFYNADRVDPIALPALLNYIKILGNTKAEVALSCAAGTYTHTVRKNGKVKVESGCLNTKRAAELSLSMKEFEKIAVNHPYIRK